MTFTELIQSYRAQINAAKAEGFFNAKMNRAKNLLREGLEIDSVMQSTGVRPDVLKNLQLAINTEYIIDLSKRLLQEGYGIDFIAEITGLRTNVLKSLQLAINTEDIIDLSKKLLKKGFSINRIIKNRIIKKDTKNITKNRTSKKMRKIKEIRKKEKIEASKKVVLELRENIKHHTCIDDVKNLIMFMQMSTSDELIAKLLDMPEEKVKKLGNRGGIIENSGEFKIIFTNEFKGSYAELNAAREKVRTKGMAQAIAEGMSEDMAKTMSEDMSEDMLEGMAQGMLTGKLLAKIEVSQNLLKEGLGIDDIMEITGLSEKALKKLQAEIEKS